MKVYRLKTAPPHNVASARAFRAGQVNERSIDELIGICKGCIVDGVVSAEEAAFLQQWLTGKRHLADRWPVNILSARIGEIFQDGVVDADERAQLFSLLQSFTGDLPTAGDQTDKSTSLPFDDPSPRITFPHRLFCFTGQFAFGPRSHCESETASRGGQIHPRVVAAINYLVVGTMGSPDWIHSSFGRKIEEAVKLRSSRGSIAIIPEQHWAAAL